jgi:hypothetical protein
VKRIVIAIAIVAAILAVVWYWRRDATKSTEVAPAHGSGSTAIGVASGATLPAGKREHTARVTPEEHRRLAEQIAAAHAEHRAHAAPAAPKLPEQGSDDDLARVQDHVLAALKEAIPFLAACYEQYDPAATKAGITTFALMTLTGDPDIGTVIDADQIYDDKHQPLPKQLDDCLRNTMQTLALPPLDTGDSVRIQYSFRFGDEGK